MTIGDFWGYKKVKIEFDYKAGLSCVLVNNPDALPILGELNLITQEVPIDSIINGNTHLRRACLKDEKWDSVMEASANAQFEQLMNDYYKEYASQIRKARMRVKKLRIKNNCLRLLGFAKR